MNIFPARRAYTQKKPIAKRGFTIFELLVSIGIFTLLTSTLLVKNAQYKGNTVITNLAYEMALAVRQAQAYGINVRQTSTGASASFNYAYGIHFDAATPSNFVLFVDSVSGDGLYNNSTEDIELFNLTEGNRVQRFCLVTGASTECSNDVSNPLTSLDITFKRPSPNAVFRKNSQTTISNAAVAEIFLLSPRGICKKIKVETTGQISVPDSNLSATCQ